MCGMYVMYNNLFIYYCTYMLYISMYITNKISKLSIPSIRLSLTYRLRFV